MKLLYIVCECLSLAGRDSELLWEKTCFHKKKLFKKKKTVLINSKNQALRPKKGAHYKKSQRIPLLEEIPQRRLQNSSANQTCIINLGFFNV